MSEDCDYSNWFTSTILKDLEQPAGFQDWVKNITQYKYTITLPDNSKVDAKLFIDFQQVFDNGAYTNYLLNRYKEIYGI